MSGEKSTHVSEEKKNIVAELKDLISTKKTVLIASIKGLPASQFQLIGKKLRGKAIVKVPKKNLIFRAIDDSGKEIAKKLEEVIASDVAVLFSDLDSFELAGELLESKNPAKAKTGQEAPEDIEIKAGMTDLLPGPAISELGAVGLKIKVTDGKLEIMGDKVIVKKGEAIRQEVADVMSKLDIKPFSIGFIPLAALDIEENKFYAEINIDKEGTLEKLHEAHGRALPFAVEMGYASPDTISFLISKAHSHGKALEELGGAEEVKEEEKLEAVEGKSDVPDEDKAEEKVQEEKTAKDVKETTAEAENEEPAPKGVPSEEGKKVEENNTPETKKDGEDK